MNVSGSNRYTLNDLRTKINDALLNKEMPDRLYQSMDGTSRMIEAIVNTRGDGWAAQVLDNEGKEMLTPDEQERFTRAFQPYLDSIIEFFKTTSHKDNEIIGGEIKTVAELMGKSQEYVDNLKKRTLGDVGGPDQIYTQIIDKFGAINSTVNGFASKYGVLRLEKEHDIEPDVRIIPEFARDLIALGAQAITDATVGPEVLIAEPTKEFLENIKVPFRLIVSLIYLFLDVARIVVSNNGSIFGRKVLSITLSLLEFLRGDWKKAILSFVGYYGMTPLLIGQVLKAVLTLFNMISPQLQETMIYGAYDSTKSLIIGILLTIFKITAPEEIRLPLIGVLQTVAQKKEELDESLESAGLQPRPDYLMPSFQDLNNIQAVITDKAFICSNEFDTLFSTVKDSALLTVIFQLVGIPTDKSTIDRKCGELLGKPYLELLVELSKPTPISDSESPAPTPAVTPESVLASKSTLSAVPTLYTTIASRSTTKKDKNPAPTPIKEEDRITTGGRRKIRRTVKPYA